MTANHEVGCISLISCAIMAAQHYLDTKDAVLTSNLQKHAKACWGEAVVKTVDTALDAEEVCKKIVPNVLKDGSITAAFERKSWGKGD